MECKVSDLVKRGHDQAAELKSSCGAVDVRSLAQLISDLATQLEVQLARGNALAAENAGLKSTCDDRRAFIMNGVQLGYIKVPTVETDPALETIRVAVSPQEPTPATDAFLAEVRAQSVEMAITHIEQTISPNHETVLNKYAAKIRQEAAK
ncbi:hypothetical protein AAGZ56_003924 [Salmonella enterica]|uniref:hypothetical protein n=1 Tax=Salmonella enterica TaxID=28901 RepID=UPI00077E0B28|nr:hypothetical protein [Salmonella enterica]EAA3796773.1 hypothetical protein [Salmonella enterica subsp. enterica serovar Javiana]ECN3616283.1 hypothetical protein [Salmonella enterica subsp. enterica serovar Enteritidis]EIO9992240.1 hypothetical protein [Salmonella enterica subsp. enterica serovar Saintpaul]EIV2217125.1 hypothetical protein [Salmonella enterica subsp. enterica serovar Reading]EAM8195575.1 hypothetical protein [Salmonella enterica]